jgi:hypothetical protein
MRNVTLLELIARDQAEHLPSTLEMFKAIGGASDDLVELVMFVEGTRKTSNVVAAIGAGALIGYYYALSQYDELLGIAADARRGEVPPC